MINYNLKYFENKTIGNTIYSIEGSMVVITSTLPHTTNGEVWSCILTNLCYSTRRV